MTEENQLLSERAAHLEDVQALIDDLIKNKDIVQNLTVLYDFKYPDMSMDVSFSYCGNFNAVLGMLERAKNLRKGAGND
jgi:hypothetical protein